MPRLRCAFSLHGRGARGRPRPSEGRRESRLKPPERLRGVLRVGAGRGVDGLAVLGDEAVDPPSRKCAAVRLHVSGLLAAIRLRLERTDGELDGKRLALVLPQEHKLRVADRARRLEPREEQAAEYEQESDRKRDHQEVGQEDALFEGNVSEFDHGDLLFSLPQQGQAASQGA